MRGQVVQWRGDNAAEADHILSNHLVRADKQGDKLHVVGIGPNKGVGIDLSLNLGDSLIVDGDRLGILRKATDKPLKETWVTWQGNNLARCKEFLKAYKVRLEVAGNRLRLFGDDSALPWFTLRLNDRLIKRDGQIIVSKAG